MAMGTTMQETIQVLLGLQELDTKIYSVKDELRRLPAERERRRKAIDARIATRDDLDGELKRLHLAIKEVDMDTTQSRQKVRKYEGELNDTSDGTVVAALQHQIRTLKRDISQAEEEGLEAVARSEELTGKRDELQAQIDEDESVFIEFEANMKREMAAAETKLEELLAERAKRLARDLDANVVDVYDRLLDSREGVALSMLDGRTCTTCYMEVPANLSVRIARGSDLVQCPSCDRILYLA
jgi:predicted  nucleic acid-binding Zn-ribbon protein